MEINIGFISMRDKPMTNQPVSPRAAQEQPKSSQENEDHFHYYLESFMILIGPHLRN